MARNMSFSITTQQMYDRTKDVTRRLGWFFLKAGDLVWAVEKGMGLKKGEKVKRIYAIRIVSVQRQPLNWITAEDVVREGFPELSVVDFVTMFYKSHKGCQPDSIVTRIEFEEYQLDKRGMRGESPIATLRRAFETEMVHAS